MWGRESPEDYIKFYKFMVYDLLERFNNVYRLIQATSSYYFPDKLNVIIKTFSIAHEYERIKILLTFTIKGVIDGLLKSIDLEPSELHIALTPSSPTILTHKDYVLERLSQILGDVESPYAQEIVMRYPYIRFIIDRIWGSMSKLRRELEDIKRVRRGHDYGYMVSSDVYLAKKKLLEKYMSKAVEYKVLKCIDEMLLLDHHEDILRRSNLEFQQDLITQVKLIRDGLIKSIYLDFGELIEKLKSIYAEYEARYKINIPAITQCTSVTCCVNCALNVLSSFYGLSKDSISKLEVEMLSEWRQRAGEQHHTYAIAVAHLLGEKIGYENVRYVVNEAWLSNIKRMADEGSEKAMVNLKWTENLPKTSLMVIPGSQTFTYSDYVHYLRSGWAIITVVDYYGDILHAKLVRGYDSKSGRLGLLVWDPLGMREVCSEDDAVKMKNRYGFVALLIAHPDVKLVSKCVQELSKVEEEMNYVREVINKILLKYEGVGNERDRD
jgi:hypothetical protein